MLIYRKERIDNTIHFFAKKHHGKTKNYLSQTFLYKYLAFFEFRCLKKYGDMPLELKYKAMEHGPVPIEIYENRNNPDYFKLSVFEETQNNIYLVKPKGRFDSDYFSESELEEMNNLIEIYAQRWIRASVISDASHRDIKAWGKTWSEKPNGVIDPIEEFDRDISILTEDELTPEEERFLIHKKVLELVN